MSDQPLAFLTASDGRGNVSSCHLPANTYDDLMDAIQGAFYGIPGTASIIAVSSRTSMILATGFIRDGEDDDEPFEWFLNDLSVALDEEAGK